MDLTITEIVDELGLEPHPEGGYYKETYRSEMSIIPDGSGKSPRNVSTSIYYLLPKGEFSSFHRIRSDELWHHYSGGTACIHILQEGKPYRKVLLGKSLSNGESFQAIIPAGAGFATEVINGDFLLAGCTVAPGFDFNDFQLADRDNLIKDFPSHRKLITLFIM